MQRQTRLVASEDWRRLLEARMGFFGWLREEEDGEDAGQSVNWGVRAQGS